MSKVVPVVVVTWRDAHLTYGDPLDADDERIDQSYIRHSVGWLVKRSRRNLVLAQTRERNRKDGRVCEVLSIPRSTIVDMEVVEVVAAKEDE